MRKITKIASVVLAVVLTFAASVLFTGCKSEIAMKDGAKAIVVAANNYQKSHESYTNFADTTLTFKSNFVSNGSMELEYKEKLEDEKTVKGTFTSTMNNTSEITVNIKNVKNDEDANAEDDIYLKITVVDVQNSKQYTVDENDLLQEQVEEKKSTKTYVLAAKEVEGELVYYITAEEKVEEKDKQDVLTKQYYQFADRYDYTSNVGEYLEKVNQLVQNSYFMTSNSSAEMLVSLLTYSKDGDMVEMSLEITTPSISSGNALLTTTSYKSSFNGKELGTVEFKMLMEAVSNGEMEMGATVEVKTSADEVVLGDLTGYTLTEDLIEIEEIPTNIDIGRA